MFSSQHNAPKQNYKLDQHPKAEDLHHFIETATNNRGIKHCYSWQDHKRKTIITLTVYLPQKGNDPEWWLHEATQVGPKMLWFYRSHDLSVLYKQLIESLGITSADSNASKQSTSLTQRLRATGSFPAQNPPPPTTQAHPTNESARPSLGKLLSGSLELRPLSSILDTASKEEATGRVLLEREGHQGIVHFVNGRPVHAKVDNITGLEALLELYSWCSGTAVFTPGTNPDTTSISLSVDQIQYRGAQLLEDIGFLLDHHIDGSSVLLKSIPDISHQEFEKRILDGPPLGLDLQRTFFQNVDGQRSLQQVAGFLSLPASQWVSITVNLLKLGLLLTPTGHMIEFAAQSQSLSGPMIARPLGFPKGGVATGSTPQTSGGFGTSSGASDSPLSTGAHGVLTPAPGTDSAPAWAKAKQQTEPLQATFADQARASASDAFPSPAVQAFVSSAVTGEIIQSKHIGVPKGELPFDSGVVHKVRSSLLNRETNIFTYEAMQFFLEYEYRRAYHFGSSFALVSFCLKPPTPSKPENASTEVVAMVVNAVNRLKNETDILGHLGEMAYMLIVPDSNTAQAAQLIDNICTRFSSAAPELGSRKPMLHFGVASIPGDTRDLKTLVAVSQQAMFKAVSAHINRVKFER